MDLSHISSLDLCTQAKLKASVSRYLIKIKATPVFESTGAASSLSDKEKHTSLINYLLMF